MLVTQPSTIILISSKSNYSNKTELMMMSETSSGHSPSSHSSYVDYLFRPLSSSQVLCLEREFNFIKDS
jgi:hypothetical protein